MNNFQDMFSDMQKAINKQAKEKHNKQYFKGPNAPQNVNTDTYIGAKKSMFEDYLTDNVEDVNDQRALDILRNAYTESTGMPPRFNFGGNFYDNYDGFGTFGMNVTDPTIGSWADAYEQDRPGKKFMQGLMDFGTDFGKSLVAGKLQGPKTKVKQRQYYRSGEDDALNGKQFDPKAYGIFGKARAKDETGDYLYGAGDIFNKERLASRKLAKEFQRGAKQDVKADLSQARRDMGYSPWWNRSEANLEQRDLLREQKRDIKNDMIDWRNWEDVPNYGPLDQTANINTQTTNQNINTSDLGLGTGTSDLLTNPWTMKKDMYGRPVDANGNLLNPLRPYGQYGMEVQNQFGGMMDPRKWMYHMGGNLPSHNHSSSAKDMSDMVSPDGRRIRLQGFSSGNPNDPLNIDALAAGTNRSGMWQVDSGNGSYHAYNPGVDYKSSDFDHWQSFNPRWGGEEPLPGSEGDAIPKIPGVTGYWSIPPGTYGYPEGSFTYNPMGPAEGFEQYWSHRKPWAPSASRVVDEATDPNKGKGKGKGTTTGNGAGAGAGAGAGGNNADPMNDYNTWLAQQAERAGNTVAGGLGNVTDVVGGGAGFQFPGAGFPGYIEVAPGIRALSWGPNTNVETFSSDTKYGMIGGRPRRKNVYMTFGTALLGSPNSPDAVDNNTMPGTSQVAITPQDLKGFGNEPYSFMNNEFQGNPFGYRNTDLIVNDPNIGNTIYNDPVQGYLPRPTDLPTPTFNTAPSQAQRDFQTRQMLNQKIAEMNQPGVAPWAGEDEGMGRRRLFRGRRAEDMSQVPTRRGYIPTQRFGGMFNIGGEYGDPPVSPTVASTTNVVMPKIGPSSMGEVIAENQLYKQMSALENDPTAVVGFANPNPGLAQDSIFYYPGQRTGNFTPYQIGRDRNYNVLYGVSDAPPSLRQMVKQGNITTGEAGVGLPGNRYIDIAGPNSETRNLPMYEYSGRPGVLYRKDSKDNWLINLSGNPAGDFIPMKDPEGKRKKVLDAQARRTYQYEQYGGPIYANGGMYPMQEPIMLSEQEIADILAAGGAIKYI
jgi:hypothetical protein